MLKNRTAFFISLAFWGLVYPAEAYTQTRQPAGMLMTRPELTAAAERAEIASKGGDASMRLRNMTVAMSIRQRLREGDFQVGDRVVVSFTSDVLHSDTLVVRTGRVLELPGRIMVPLEGVLRSEVSDRVSTELMKYVKAEQVEVTPLMRVGILGDVAHPGYFAFASDLPITDAIMGAGGPTATADLDRSIVRRGNAVYRSTEETRAAIANGFTLDQFGLNAGDELVVGQRRESRSAPLIGLLAAVTSVATLFVALRH
jgi:protein involved in polysaccharide export with SLBB domain